uniref:RNA uridylyltransferase n=1 Tax=Gongylonema pulchrum TaxID=637853 RepID=A0A183E5X1_9BILA
LAGQGMEAACNEEGKVAEAECAPREEQKKSRRRRRKRNRNGKKQSSGAGEPQNSSDAKLECLDEHSAKTGTSAASLPKKTGANSGRMREASRKAAASARCVGEPSEVGASVGEYSGASAYQPALVENPPKKANACPFRVKEPPKRAGTAAAATAGRMREAPKKAGFSSRRATLPSMTGTSFHAVQPHPGSTGFKSGCRVGQFRGPGHGHMAQLRGRSGAIPGYSEYRSGAAAANRCHMSAFVGAAHVSEHKETAAAAGNTSSDGPDHDDFFKQLLTEPDPWSTSSSSDSAVRGKIEGPASAANSTVAGQSASDIPRGKGELPKDASNFSADLRKPNADSLGTAAVLNEIHGKSGISILKRPQAATVNAVPSQSVPVDESSTPQTHQPSKSQQTSKTKPRTEPLVVKDNFLDGVDLTPGMCKLLQNGEIEMLQLQFSKPEGKDFIHLILFECTGPPGGAKHVSRNGAKICVSAVMDENTPAGKIHMTPYELNRYSLPYLQKHYIYRKKDSVSRFVRAVYYCEICHYHIWTVAQAVSHFTAREHIDNEEKEAMSKKLESLPEPVKDQMASVEVILHQQYKSAELTDEQYETAKRIASSLSLLLQANVHKNVSLSMFGSYYMKLATASSDVNLALTCPPELSFGQSLFRVKETLEDSTIGIVSLCAI